MFAPDVHETHKHAAVEDFWVFVVGPTTAEGRVGNETGSKEGFEQRAVFHAHRLQAAADHAHWVIGILLLLAGTTDNYERLVERQGVKNERERIKGVKVLKEDCCVFGYHC